MWSINNCWRLEVYSVYRPYSVRIPVQDVVPFECLKVKKRLGIDVAINYLILFFSLSQPDEREKQLQQTIYLPSWLYVFSHSGPSADLTQQNISLILSYSYNTEGGACLHVWCARGRSSVGDAHSDWFLAVSCRLVIVSWVYVWWRVTPFGEGGRKLGREFKFGKSCWGVQFSIDYPHQVCMIDAKFALLLDQFNYQTNTHGFPRIRRILSETLDW